VKNEWIAVSLALRVRTLLPRSFSRCQRKAVIMDALTSSSASDPSPGEVLADQTSPSRQQSQAAPLKANLPQIVGALAAGGIGRRPPRPHPDQNTASDPVARSPSRRYCWTPEAVTPKRWLLRPTCVAPLTAGMQMPVGGSAREPAEALTDRLHEPLLAWAACPWWAPRRRASAHRFWVRVRADASPFDPD